MVYWFRISYPETYLLIHMNKYAFFRWQHDYSYSTCKFKNIFHYIHLCFIFSHAVTWEKLAIPYTNNPNQLYYLYCRPIFYKPYDLYIYVFILYISSKTNWPADSSHCIPEQSLLFCRDNNYCANTNIFWILNNPEGKWRRNILLFPSNKLCINFLCCYFFKPFKRNLHLCK